MRNLVFLVVGALAGCVGDLPSRECAQDIDCVSGGHEGQCLLSMATGSQHKWCAFEAVVCGNKLQWGPLAGDGLAGLCVIPGTVIPDAPTLPDGPTVTSDAPPAPDAPEEPDAGPAQLTLDQTDYTFAAIAPGTSAMHTFTVTNTGGATSGALAISLGGADADRYALDVVGCQGTKLDGGTGCSFSVTFTADSTTVRHASVAVGADPGGNGTVGLTGSGLAPASLSADPPSVDFGKVTNTGESVIGVTIQNDGAVATGTLTASITDPANLFTLKTNGCLNKTLGQGASCAVSVRFAPTSTGTKTATLTVGDGVKTVTVTLGGTSETAGTLKGTPSPATFATVALGATSMATVTVKNTGGATVTGLSTSLSGGDASDFTVMTDGCNGQNLVGDAMCDVTLKFSPAVAGVKSASLTIGSTSGGSTSVPLAATATVRLTVVPEGTGSGTVTSVPTGISCGATCFDDFTTSSVKLTESPSGDSTFGGWVGGGCSGTADCTVSLSAAATVHATFTKKLVLVTIKKTGAGTGTVSSSPGSIDCGATCMFSFPAGQQISLSAMADAGMAFTGWSGAGCSGTGPCLFTPTSATTVTATFQDLIVVSASVNVSGNLTAGGGTGVVVSSPSGLTCTSGTCSAQFPRGTQLKLTATADEHSIFAGFAGACSTLRPRDIPKLYSATCALTVAPGLATASAYFAEPVAINVSATEGTGMIIGPTGASCTPPCSVTGWKATELYLRGSPSSQWTTPNSDFGCGASKSCLVRYTTTSVPSVSVQFGHFQLVVDVKTVNGGTGRVVSTPAGISCDTASGCYTSNHVFSTADLPITLTATSTSGGAINWYEDPNSEALDPSGCDKSTSSTCLVPVGDKYDLGVVF